MYTKTERKVRKEIVRPWKKFSYYLLCDMGTPRRGWEQVDITQCVDIHRPPKEDILERAATLYVYRLDHAGKLGGDRRNLYQISDGNGNSASSTAWASWNTRFRLNPIAKAAAT